MYVRASAYVCMYLYTHAPGDSQHVDQGAHLKNDAANMIFSCGPCGTLKKWCREHDFLTWAASTIFGPFFAPREPARLEMMLRTSISHVGAGRLRGTRA